MELAFLWEYRLALEGNYSWWMQIFDNIMLFVPMGWLYGEVRDKTTWIRAFLLGVVGAGWVEILQLVLKLGLFEWDDIFNNTIGMMLGYGICRAVVRHDGRRSCRS